MAVVIDSGEVPSAIGKTGKDLRNVVAKWQHKVNIGFNVSSEWLLSILRELDEHEVWKAWGAVSRDAFIADVLMLDYEVVEGAIPEIVQRVTHGESVSIQKKDGSTLVISKQEEIAARQEKAKKLREEGMTQREIAEELGVSQPTVHADLSENRVITEKPDKEPRKVIGYRITQYTKPETAARRIREVLGDEFADSLAAFLPV